MRWGLAWTFDASITFPVRISHSIQLTTALSECFHYVYIFGCICTGYILIVTIQCHMIVTPEVLVSQHIHRHCILLKDVASGQGL